MRRSARRYVVAIGDQGARPVLEWLATVAGRGDRIRIVHAYQPMPYATVDWQLPVDDDALLYPAAARHTADAARLLRRQRPDLRIEAKIVRCAADRGLLEAAGDADLLVVGRPHHMASTAVLAHLSRQAPCPVLVVGDGHPPALPSHAATTVLLRDPASEQPMLDVAFAEAAERGHGLIVLRPWHPAPGAGLLYAEIDEQKWLDELLSDWCARYPTVGVSVELRLGDTANVLRAHAYDDAVLVMASEAGLPPSQPTLDPVIAETLAARSGPVLLVPLAPAEQTAGDRMASLVSDPPTEAQPATAQPVSAQPATAQPVSAQPATAQPASAQPASAQPASAQPVSVQPATDPDRRSLVGSNSG